MMTFHLFLLIARMSENTLKFNNIKLNKKEFYKSKQPIDLMLVNAEHIVTSDKFKHSDKDFRYFIGYQEGKIVKALCIILPQMSGYIKYFENGGKNMSFIVKDDNVLDKYNKIWDKIKEKLNIKFHRKPVFDQKYLKVKVREFNGVIKTNFLGNKVPKENMHYICIASIAIDSVMRTDKKNYSQIYLEECKYKAKKTKMSRFISTELKSESDSEAESKSDTELMAKLKSGSGSDSE